MKISRSILVGFIIAVFLIYADLSFSANETKKKTPTQAKTAALKISIEGEGTGIEKPIVIKGAPDNISGVALEYGVLRGLYPDAKVINQQLLRQGGRSYDVMALQSQDGREFRVFFDITDFIGKLPR
ncbi:MAG: hypothetical protein ACLQPD_09145 [Desulfomonilaceae bacterium]